METDMAIRGTPIRNGLAEEGLRVLIASDAQLRTQRDGCLLVFLDSTM